MITRPFITSNIYVLLRVKVELKIKLSGHKVMG